MKDFILVSPWSKELRDKSYNPKNYPWWPEVIADLERDWDIVQIGVSNEVKLVEDFRINLPLETIGELLMSRSCFTWISVDNFLPHLANLVTAPPGVVLWGTSDPNIFGYKKNKNLLKARKYLRADQFGIWDGRKYDKNVFVPPEKVVEVVRAMSY